MAFQYEFFNVLLVRFHLPKVQMTVFFYANHIFYLVKQ